MNIRDVRSRNDVSRSTTIVTTKDIKILIAGNSGVSNTISEALQIQQYAAVCCVDGIQLYDQLEKGEYDLVIIDMVPGDIDVVYAIQFISMSETLPYIIIRSNTVNTEDRVLTLELGADDCIPVDCDVREIRARVRSLFRRKLHDAARHDVISMKGGSSSQTNLSSMGWVLHKNKRHLLSPSGDPIPLTNSEYSILHALFSEPGVIKDRTSLRSSKSISEIEYNDRTINAFLSRLRRKIAPYGGENLVESVRGQGYRLNISEF